MKLYYFILLMFKRYLKKPAFLAILILVPLCCIFLKGLGFDGDIRINAGLYSESKVDLEPLLNYDGAVKFTVFDTLEEMKSSVSSKKSECGYYLTKSLPAVYNKEAANGSVVCIKSPSTAFDKVVNEILFSELFKTYAYDIAENLAAQDGNDNTATLKAVYNRYLNEDAVISLSYEYIDSSTDNSDSATPFSYLKGIFGIFIMLGALLGSFTTAKDEKAGLFKTLPPYKKSLLIYSYFLTPSVLCAASALAGFYFSGAFSPRAELLNTLIYALTSVAFAALIYALFPSPKAISAVTAFLPLGCLIFCPIFADTSAVIKSAALIQKLLIPTYYIQSSALKPLLVLAALSFICLILRKR